MTAGVEVGSGVGITVTTGTTLAVGTGVGVEEYCGPTARENQVRFLSDQPSGSRNIRRELASVETTSQHTLPSAVPLVNSSGLGSLSGMTPQELSDLV